MISGRTTLIAHIGYPTETFKSPMIYNPWFERTGVDAVVVPVGVRPADYGRVLEALARVTNLHGALVTMPHKVATMALVAEASPAARFVHVSSAEIYGLSFQAGVPLTEEALPRPANPYAASKAAADIAIGEMALRGLKAVRMRPFNQTGPGQSDGFVVGAFAHQVARIAAGKQEPVIRTGALDRWRDFLDVRDVCEGYALALAAEL